MQQPDPAQLRRELGLLSEEEIAAVAGVDLRTIRNWRSERRGPPFCKLGGTVVYQRETFLRWLSETEKETQQ